MPSLQLPPRRTRRRRSRSRAKSRFRRLTPRERHSHSPQGRRARGPMPPHGPALAEATGLWNACRARRRAGLAQAGAIHRETTGSDAREDHPTSARAMSPVQDMSRFSHPSRGQRSQTWTHEEYLAAAGDRGGWLPGARPVPRFASVPRDSQPGRRSSSSTGMPCPGGPSADLVPGIGRVTHRGPHRRPTRRASTGKIHLATGLEINAAHHDPRTAVGDRNRIVHPAQRRSRRRTTALRPGTAPRQRTDHLRRGRLPALRAGRCEPVLPNPCRRATCTPH